MKKYAVILVLLLIFGLRFFYVCYYSASNCLVGDVDSFDDFSGLVFLRNIFSNQIREKFPSPHSELLLGMLLGINDLKNNSRFNDVLERVGLIHVVVVSGYNISLIFDLVLRVFGSKYKFKSLLTAQVITFLYCLLCGFQPPVLRACLMGFVISYGKYYGRSLDTLVVLLFCGLLMLVVQPFLLFNLSFQLSFLATLSLVSFSEITYLYIKKGLIGIKPYIPKNCHTFGTVFVQDFSTSVAAQILVWPIISYNFGRVSILSPFVNALVLWTVPLDTTLGGLYLFSSFIYEPLSWLLFYIIYPFLDLLVLVSRFFSDIPFCSWDLKIGLHFLLSYYAFLTGFLYFRGKNYV